MLTSLPPRLQVLLDKLSDSRDLSISILLHAVLVLIFGGTALYQVVREPTEFQSSSPRQFVEASAGPLLPPKRETSPQGPQFDPLVASRPAGLDLPPVVTTRTQTPLIFTQGITVPIPGGGTSSGLSPAKANPSPLGGHPDRISAELADAMRPFVNHRVSRGVGQAGGDRKLEFDFTAYVGQYSGGDWNSTIRMEQGKVVTGSLPNLLYLMSAWSKDQINTNYKNVKALRLDDWETIAATRPPFIFLTGTRDFSLSEKEVGNLQKYVRLGGCIWGDSSLPGKRSRFDIAFRREMRRVISDGNKDFEALPANHPIFTQGYHSGITEAPPGLNFTKEKVMALKIYGEIAILYTANDYGDMWQVGLNQDGEIDLRRDENGRYVAINPMIYQNRNLYMRNLSPESLATSFRFGTNVVFHLLTRWEEKLQGAPTL